MKGLRHVALCAVTTLAIAGLGGSTASAATYCVNAPGCAGTVSADIPTAVSAASADAAADEIVVGASSTPYVLGSSVTLPAGKPVTIRGAGPGQTSITFGSGAAYGFVVEDPASVVQDLAVHASVDQIAIWLKRGTVRSVVAESQLGFGMFVDSGTVEDSTVTSALSTPMNLSTDPGSTTVLRRVRVLAHPEAGRVIAITSSTGGIQGTTTIVGSTVRGGITLMLLAPDAPTPVRIADTVVHSQGAIAAIGVQPWSCGTFAATVEARNLTLVGHPVDPRGYTGALSSLTSYPFQVFNSCGSNTNSLALVADGVAATGFSGAGSVRSPFSATSSASLTVANSVLGVPLSARDMSSGSVTFVDAGGNSGADPGLVDVAGGDLRPRAGSPLVDAGPTSLAPWQDGVDQLGAPRVVGGRTDVGAIEYQRTTPTVSVSAVSPARAAGGTTVTVTAVGSDADPGEAARLTYAWRLPDGSVATGPSASFTAPDAPGDYAVQVRATDPAGASGVASATFTVPVERVAPKVVLAPVAVKRAKLLARTPLSVVVTVNERATAKVSIVASVKVRTGRRTTTVTVPLGSGVLAMGAGARTVKVVPSKAALAKLGRLLAKRGATLSIRVVATATDASRNTGTARPAALRVT